MRYIILIPVFLMLIFAGCSGGTSVDDRPAVTVSILPQEYMVKRIAGDNFRINVLVPPGASPETYEPTPGQMRDVANSSLYFRIGYIEFERTVLNNIQLQNNELMVINTAEGVDLIAGEIVEHDDHVHLYGVDPHIWLSIPAVKVQVRNITESLIKKDPDNKDLYAANSSEFVKEMDQMHESFTERFEGTDRKTFLIFHPALAYFARDYGLNQISIEEEGKNPTASNMKKIIDLAREEGINDVFIQLEFERENAMAVARELGGEVIEIDPLSADWKGNMEVIAEKLHNTLTKN
ncbi:MAG: metal ABC transporter solute-binding protein, Zn/Mn family [Bacteroidales bacterium]